MERLGILRMIIPNEDKIEIRSDGGTEFNNAAYGIIAKKTTSTYTLFQKQVHGYKLSLNGVSEL
jgi:hypothetical protein